MEEIRKIDADINDAIIERPLCFQLGHRSFALYHSTLGKHLILRKLYAELPFDKQMMNIDPNLEMLRVCSQHKEEVCLILAYGSMSKKEEIFDVSLVEKRKEVFKKHLDLKGLATLLTFLLEEEGKYAQFVQHLKIDREREDLAKVLKVKDDGSSLTFGGLSLYGTLIGSACEKYGWTMDYVVWGISLLNLYMLSADSVVSINLTKEEKKKVRIPKNRERISGDDPRNKELIKQMLKNG